MDKEEINMQFSTQKKPILLQGSFYKDIQFSEKSVVISPILDSSTSKEIRIAFKEGQSMKAHKTKFPITVMTLRGSIEFTLGKETYILDAGDIIALEGNIVHALYAKEESIVKLSLHKEDTVKRVEKVLED